MTLFGWLLAGADWHAALSTAIAVLIITCPCALALAVPAVQVAAVGALFRRGVLVKSPTALERLAAVRRIVFDKTGTLTLGHPVLIPDARRDTDALSLAAALAATSRHPLSRALVAAAPPVAPAVDAVEQPGQGIVAGPVRLGSRVFCGVAAGPADDLLELWLVRPGHVPCRFAFRDDLRADAAATVRALAADGFAVELLSGDRASVVAAIAAQAGIAHWRAAQRPAEKVAALSAGQPALMVGDGLNDAPALAAAHASMAPASGVDVARSAADVVFQGALLGPVRVTLGVARRAGMLARQNLALALVYNVLAVPLAVAGLVTPLLAAAAMSGSSLLVVANALRAGRVPR
jgi:Cu2+-exporting ATPase